jgi:ATP-binding protein involved in chromosome partitioning
VGKSTVSANLAVALAQSGAQVGLMDADVYGPSIPTLMGLSEKPVSGPNQKMIPVTQYDVKIISMGFFLPEEKAVIWRGPMLDKMITQFLGGVQWGELDYLIIDLPPGTGDIQLSLCQKVPLTGAVIVSTPQDVALNVAQKAIAMFNQLNTPVLGIVENMSHYRCSHCGQRDEIFGTGGARKVSESRGLPFLGEIPLSTNIRVHSDQGKPVVLADPESEQAKAFLQVAENTAAQISIRAMAGDLEQDIKVSF